MPETKDEPFTALPIDITVTVGRTRARIGELMSLDPDAVLRLDRSVDDPVELYAGDTLIARGDLHEVEDGPPGRLAVRITEIVRAPGRG